MGVWIETRELGEYFISGCVTPCVGVWIETERRKDIERKERHTLRGCVD